MQKNSIILILEKFYYLIRKANMDREIGALFFIDIWNL